MTAWALALVVLTGLLLPPSTGFTQAARGNSVIDGRVQLPRQAIHLSIPYLERALSPAAATAIRAVRRHEPRMVREDFGQTVAQDSRYARAATRAVARYERAADQGYIMARYNLARALAQGRGIKRDLRRAMETFAMTAQQGNMAAMLRLAEFHLAGLVTPENRVEAQALYYVAASLKNEGAALARTMLALHLDNAQLELARKRSHAIRTAMPRLDLVMQRNREQELLTAAAEGDLEKVNALLQDGVDANAINALGRTSIVTAAWRGHYDVVRSLIEAGVEIDAADNQGRTALTWASINGHADIVALLLEEVALVDVRDEKGLTPLMRASWNGHEGIVKTLIDGGADINAADDSGMTALQRAEGVNERTIVALLSAGKGTGASEVLVLLANDDGKVGTLAMIGRGASGKDIVLNKAKQMVRIDSKGGIRRGIATDADLLREFGKILASLPAKPAAAKSAERRTKVRPESDDGGPWVYAWPVLALFLLYLSVRWLRRRRRSQTFD